MNKLLEGQAGARIIISCQERGRRFIRTSHYSNLAEFFKFCPLESLIWYQIKGQEKVTI